MKRIISLLLAFILIFSLAGCKNRKESTEDTSTSESTIEATTEKIDYDNLVTDAYKYEYSDKDGDYKYNIPKIMLEGKNIENINSEIWDWCYDNAMTNILDIISAGTSVYLLEISYEWAVNDDILSLCVLRQWDAGISDYKVYNVNIKTCETVSKNDILSYAGFSEEEYINVAKEAIGSEYLDYYVFENYSDINEFAKIHKEVLEKTLTDENISQALPFLNEDGELCIICAQYSAAGADVYYRLYNLENFKLNPAYLEVLNTSISDNSTSDYTVSSTQDLVVQNTEPEQEVDSEWKNLYIEYIENMGSNYKGYSYCEIAYVDNDDIPEIFLSSDSAVPGQAILWISNGTVHEKSEIGYGSVHYYEKQRLFCTSWMNHGSYADVVYSLNNGEVNQLHKGNIDGRIDEQSGTMESTYTWDNQIVDKEQYDEYFNEAFNRSSANEAEFSAGINSLIEKIKNM